MERIGAYKIRAYEPDPESEDDETRVTETTGGHEDVVALLGEADWKVRDGVTTVYPRYTRIVYEPNKD